MAYGRFFAMIATSTVVMFGLMYLNTYVVSQVYFSQTRMWMALYMGAAMAIIMLAFMLGMYSSKRANAAIFAGAAIVFAAALFLVRSQVTVGDVAYMKAMIPHHSIAIMTSSRARISDPRVRKLADEIIAAQEKEIAEMKFLVADIEANGNAATDLTPPEGPPEVVSVAEALARPVLATLDLGGMTPEEVAAAVPPGPACRFRRTEESPPVLAVRLPEAGAAAPGAVKLAGGLVALAGPAEPAAVAAGPAMAAEGLRLEVRRLEETPIEHANAELVFSLDEGLTVGYRGFYDCDA